MKKIKNYFKNTFNQTDFSGLSVFGRGQHFDWEVLLTFFLIIIFIAASFSTHVFLGVKAGDIFQDEYKAPVHNEKIDIASLDRVIKSFEDRAVALKSLQAKKPVFIDPSL